MRRFILVFIFFIGNSYIKAEWLTQTLDFTGVMASYWNTSIVIDTNNYPRIVYCDYSQYISGWFIGSLKYAKWDGTSWKIQTVDSTGDVGYTTSIILDSNNNPHISYYDNTNHNIKYAKWTGSKWDIKIVDSAGNWGNSTDI